MLTRTIAWNSPLGQIGAEMDRLFDAVFAPARPAAAWRAPATFPPLNLAETEDAVVVEAEVPGVSRDNLQLSVQNDLLTIRGERSAPPAGEGFLRQERWFGQFERTISLPASIDAEHVQATMTDGVLTVTLRKAAEARPRKIEVRALPTQP